MEYRLIALDIDGTLVNSAKKLTETTKNTLLRAQQKGIRLAVASGRAVSGLRQIVEALKLSEYGGYVIAFNGARVIRALDGKIICQEALDLELLPAVFDFATEHGLNAATYSDETYFVKDPLEKYLEFVGRIEGLPVKERNFSENPVDFPVPKVLFSGEPERIAQLEPKARERFGEAVNVFRSEPFLLEILPPRVDKASALRNLLSLLGWEREALLACGDGYNDVSMLRFAGMGVAMANASLPVREAADFITASNNEDGVALAVRRFCLHEESI